jgi:hypothetical protein
MNWIYRVALIAIAFTCCVSCSSFTGYPGGMSKAEYEAMVARDAADPNFDYVDKMNEIDATKPPPCGICDPITRATPDGTYTLPPQNR